MAAPLVLSLVALWHEQQRSARFAALLRTPLHTGTTHTHSTDAQRNQEVTRKLAEHSASLLELSLSFGGKKQRPKQTVGF